jgi:gas vesicle protein
MSIGKVVFGAMAGLAIGAIAGILFAPEKGSVTRKQIMDKGDDCMDEIKSGFDKTFSSLTEMFKSTKKDTEELVDKGKSIYHDAKNEAKKAVENFEQDVKADIKNAIS